VRPVVIYPNRAVVSPETGGSLGRVVIYPNGAVW